MKILIVDDEPAILGFLEDLLGHHGYDCDALLDAREALTRLAAQDYDLIISDIDMPNQSGLDLLVEIRRLLPEIPVILTTGNRDPDYELRSCELRASYLEKPYSGSHLLRVMEASVPAQAARAAG